MCLYRGYSNHADPETDSDGDGGARPKLRGKGHIEFSKKGIPHGILHFVRQLQLAGHIFMHDTTASEAAHRQFVKKVMNRVRKGTDYDTTNSSIDWVFRVRTWAKIIDDTAGPSPPKRQRKEVVSLKVLLNASKQLKPTHHFVDETGQHTFSPLRTGGNRLVCNDARVSYHELGQLVASFTGWDVDYVNTTADVELFCSAERCDPGKERRNYWATEHLYPYDGGSRRDMMQVEWKDDEGHSKLGCAQLTAFIRIRGDVHRGVHEGVLVRWMDKSSHSTTTDNKGRPFCDYPLSFNHCLWQWSKTDRDRESFRVRGFMNNVRRDELWSHVDEQEREDVVRSEIRARYDILPYNSIVCHANVHKDPSTNHMLQTLQIV